MEFYQNKADKLNLSSQRYWHLLLHMVNDESEIDDKRFFLAKEGKTNAKDELNATIKALYNEKTFEDDSTACRFPARKAWLQEELNLSDLPQVQCKEYDKILKRLNPKSATLVFPAAHINSPASMFGHTFLRLNSAYKSKLLSYAINYAADANPETENGVIFAIKGLVGGYYGKYSLLPYYEKLNDYKDTEQRDIWEYDLNLNEDEVARMVKHIWELNGTHSNYFFFTENCSYNMLWFIELARPSVDLRGYFNYQVIPLETVHAALSENLIDKKHFRASKRTILLKYESLIDEKYLSIPKKIVNSQMKIEDIISNSTIPTQQKMYILEASAEFLEYTFIEGNIEKKPYLEKFHKITQTRASLGKGKKLNIKTPPNPIDSHRAIRTTAGFGFRENKEIGFLGIRPSYHSLEDSNYGFLRGTQIEFFDLLLSYSDDKIEVENATIISIVSLAQRSEFFNTLSWRTKYGFDKKYLDNETNAMATVGAGYSWGNENAFTYILVDPVFYYRNQFNAGIGASIGLKFDKYSYMSTNIEATARIYDTGDSQNLIEASQNFRLSQNFQLKLKYDYKEIYGINKSDHKTDNEETFQIALSYHF